MVSGCLTATYWLCGRCRQLDLDEPEGVLVENPRVEEERGEDLFNFPLGGNADSDEPPPAYVRIIFTQ